MLAYLLRRTGYSVLIIAGVLILTFLLFRVAAGDPAAALLGKNPSPEEIENLRQSLGADKPLFYGRWKTTELYPGADFTKSRTVFPGVTLHGKPESKESGLQVRQGDSVCFKRNFLRENEKIRVRVIGNGQWKLTAGKEEFPFPANGELVLPDQPSELCLTGEGELRQIRFFRPTRHAFDSQALASLKEVITFKKTFPYVDVFNFGLTLQTREPIRERLWRGMWPSLFVMLPIFIGELIFGIVLAMLSAATHGTWVDRVIMVISGAGMSISYLALIIFGQWYFGYYLNWFPVWGWGDIRYLLLPVAIGIFSGTGSGARFYRTVFLNESGREYLRTARAKGLPVWQIYFKHLLKNALAPIITRASTVLPFLFTGSLLLESFFGIPGLGYEGVNALNDSDMQILKALVILGAFLFDGINLITDLSYA
jgi:peptide/nickel transport system permease protein